eukprot:254738_1
MAGTVCMQETPELQRTSSGPCKLNYSRTWTVGDRSEVSTRIQRSRSSSLFQYPPPSRPVVVEKHELAQSSKGIVLDLDRSAKRSQVKLKPGAWLPKVPKVALPLRGINNCSPLHPNVCITICISIAQA